MTRDQLVRLLLRLAIAFVGLQIAAVLVFLAFFAYFALGLGDSGFPAVAMTERWR